MAGNGKRKKRSRPQFSVNSGKVAKTNEEGHGKAERKDRKKGKAGAVAQPNSFRRQFRECHDKLTEEQKAKYQKDGLCYYVCGKFGH